MDRLTASRSRTRGTGSWARVRRIATIVCLASSLAGLAAAQSADSAAVLGVAKDSQGGVLPGVTVTARNVDTGLTRTDVTNETGGYRLRALPPGRYEFTAELSGFRTAQRKGVTLTIGAEASIDFVLPIGGVTETVVVEANAPIVDTTTATVGANLERGQLESLPTISRDFTDFLRVVAGTASTDDGITFNGARAESNAWQVDGTANRNESAGTQNTSPQIDSIAEFQVLTNNFRAEYGNAAGAVVNAITRSGTNSYHGSLFTYYRDENFRARSPFEDESKDKAPFKRLYTGGTFGGPIRKNKAFIFGAYERLGQDANQEQSWAMPAASSAWSTKMTTFFNTYGVDPALFGNGGTQYLVANHPTTNHKGTVRFDYDFGRGQMLTMRYGLYESKTRTDKTGTIIDLNGYSENATNHDFTANHKWAMSGTKLNEIFFLYNHSHYDAENDADMPLLYTPSWTIGGSDQYPQLSDDWRINLKDHFTWSLGAKHQMKAGAEFRMLRSTANVQNLYKGMYVFPNQALFVRGFAVMLVQQVGNPEIPIRDNQVSGFIQDDWRPTRELTLSLGVRYDYQYAKLPAISSTPIYYDGGILPSHGLEDPAVSRDKNNLAPRFGFTWAPDSKQAIYGGTGIYYDQVILNNFVSAMFTPPYRTIYKLPMPAFPAATTDFSGADTSSSSIGYLDPNFKAPYNWNTTLGYRRELTPSVGIDVSMIYNRGEEQQMVIQANPYLIGTGDLYGSSGTRTVADAGSAQKYYNGGISRYKALRVELKQRMRHHVQGGIAYTLGKGEDNSTTKITKIQVPGYPDLNYGPGTFDATHRLTAHVEADLPYGLQLAGIAEFRSKLPLNIIAEGYDLNGDGMTDDWVNEKVCVLVACDGLNYSRNSVRSLSTAQANQLRAVLGLDPISTFEKNPNYWNVDASLRKQVRFGGQSVSFSAEVFNLFNLKQYSLPDQAITSDTFGQYTSVMQPRTFQLGVHYRF